MDNPDKPTHSNAHVFQINNSPGGVPKLPVRQALLDILGLAGDAQANLDVHGGPERAVCLYSLERILALQAEGHPIFPGSTGENLTLVGLDWGEFLPGQQLLIGDRVLIELTRYTNPCSTIRPSFADQDSNRISQKLHPGWSRLYARVVQPGTIRVGDPVMILPVDR